MLISDIWSAFRQGKSLANSAAWKNRAIAGNNLALLFTTLLGIAAALGYRFEVDADTVEALAGGIAAAVFIINNWVHISTSDKVGLPSKPDSTGSDDILKG